MAKTKTTPGPKPRYEGKRRDYHILLPLDVAEAFEHVAKQHGGVVAFTEKIIRERQEVSDYMRYGDGIGRFAKQHQDQDK